MHPKIHKHTSDEMMPIERKKALAVGRELSGRETDAQREKESVEATASSLLGLPERVVPFSFISC